MRMSSRLSFRTAPDDARLIFTPAEWTAFLSGARRGEFDV